MKNHTYKLGNGKECTIIVEMVAKTEIIGEEVQWSGYKPETKYSVNVKAIYDGNTYSGYDNDVHPDNKAKGIVAKIGEKIGIKSDINDIIIKMIADVESESPEYQAQIDRSNNAEKARSEYDDHCKMMSKAMRD